MIRVYNSRVLLYKNRVAKTSSVWSFDITGTQWPPVTRTGVGVNFNTPSYIFIDFGDGTGVHRYDTKVVGSLHGVTFSTGAATATTYAAYVYQDGRPSTYRRTVRYIIPEQLKVQTLSLGSALALVSQVLRINFSELIGLINLTLVSTLLQGLDDTFLYSRSISYVSFNSAFGTDTKYDGRIPEEMLINKSYTDFTWRAPLGGKSFNLNNMDKIPLVAGTLTSLDLAVCSIADTNGSDGSLPANWNQLTKLTSFNLPQNLWTVPPPVINQIPSITFLSIGSTSLTSWGDLSNLVNLTSWTMYQGVNLPTALPAYFLNFKVIKSVNFSNFSKYSTGGYPSSNPAKLDALIASIYDFYNVNVAKSGATSLPFRAVTWQFGTSGSSDVPTGVYQQPAGYNAGISNGNPASSKEILWLLVNQYACNVVYATS